MRQQVFIFSEFWSLLEEKKTNNRVFAKRRKSLLPSFRLLSSVRINGGDVSVGYFWPVEWGAMRYV